MIKDIKLVIWDMDYTFWRGIISDGDVFLYHKRVDFLKRLVDHGVINSICSKNTYSKFRKKLEEHNVWKYFVFPDISWEPKGERLRGILDACGVRSKEALFIDDTASNLIEADRYCPHIHAIAPILLTEEFMTDFTGYKKDSSYSQLKKYRRLEKRMNWSERQANEQIQPAIIY